MESVNCIQLPVVQGTAFQSDGLAISTPGTGCVMKSLQSQSSPIIAFPQLQSIRFVQTSFHPEQETTSSLNNSSTISAQVQPQPSTTAQVNMIRTQDTIAQINTQNNNARNNVQNIVATQGQVQNTLSTAMGVQSQNRAQNAIVIQHQTAAPVQPRQIATAVHQQQQQSQQQQQQYAGPSVTVSSRPSRVSNQGSQRGSRNSNKEQGGRSRSSTKEPPGAVNLERSYQICQAVNSSNRELHIRCYSSINLSDVRFVYYFDKRRTADDISGHTKFTE